MVNIDDFIKRLENILDYYGLNASSFADKIGVQRSSMSHLLSGRNKPSLDFVMKILEVFPEIDLYWILNGKGSFPKKEEEVVSRQKENSSQQIKSTAPTTSLENLNERDLFSKIDFENKEPKQISNNYETKKTNEIKYDEIEKIVFFYKNGTFKVYQP